MNNTHIEDLPFLTDTEIETQSYSYYNADSIHAPSGKISFILLPDSRITGSMTMSTLWGLPEQGTLTIRSGSWLSKLSTYYFVAEGYLVEAGGKKTHVGPLSLALALDEDGKKGTLNGVASNTVVESTSCYR